MEYLALYRKYRPSMLEEMVGQSEIRKIIASSIKNGTISHAYLFSGPRGTGKTTTAKIMAKMVNCQNLIDDTPCNKCECCLSVNNGSDVIEIDAASNNGVDEIRDLREKANLVPSVCRYKVYIIDEVHMLTNQAFNALLKTLEEPPKHVIFILATTEYYKIPLTITSRCQKFQFNKIDNVDIVKRLKEISSLENINISDDALYEIAKISDGGMRDSINYLDQLRSFTQEKIEISDVFDVCGNISFEEIYTLLFNLKDGNLEKIVYFLENLNNSGKNYNKFLEDMMIFLKDLILYKKNVNSKLIKINIEYLEKLSIDYSFDDIFYVIDMINCLMDKIKYVSRQSIVVISNFLIASNKLCIKNEVNESNSDSHYVDSNISLAFDFMSNKENSNDNSVNIDSKNTFILDNKINNYNKNKDIIINNSFALADKKLKLKLQEKWKCVNDYLTDNYFSVVAGKWSDASIEVVGENYIIFSVKYESLVEGIYSFGKLSNDFINTLLDGIYNYVVITVDEWNYYKNKYINDIEQGLKYELKKLIIEDNFQEIEKKSVTIVDKLFDIVGEENIEFK